MAEENFDIHSDTGLPELPEGYAWYVKSDKGEAVVCICSVTEEWHEEGNYLREHDWLYYIGTEETRQATRKDHSSNFLLSAFSIKVSKRFTEVKYLRYKVADTEAASEWSDSAILLAAVNLMDTWTARQNYQANKDRLSGPYPPNKLKIEEA